MSLNKSVRYQKIFPAAGCKDLPQQVTCSGSCSSCSSGGLQVEHSSRVKHALQERVAIMVQVYGDYSGSLVMLLVKTKPRLSLTRKDL